MAYRKFNDEVLYPQEQFVTLSSFDLSYLKTEALKNPRKRIRLCSHQSVTDTVHEMFIIHTRDTYVRPHKHFNKSESLYLMEGQVDVVFFDDEGKIIRRVQMGELSSGKEFYYRLSEPLYHTLDIKSDVLCFLEVTRGPFELKDTMFAPWAPDGSDPAQIDQFMRRVRK